jgi:Ser/Thr protein kinase RdoA (MazF antagonist)
VPDADTGFSSTAILPTLEEACTRAGLSSDGAKLLRLGENAIYQLVTDPVVVRIARSADRLPRVRRELCVARWLASSNVPAVRVRDDIDQPTVVHGHPITFWRTVTGGDPVPDHVDLGRLLAAFHNAPGCPCDLPSFDPLGPSYSRLAKAKTVTQDDRDFLKAHCDDLNDELQHLQFALPRGPIHGDAHTSNLLTDHGQVVLIDFENAAIGPPEWDLLPIAIGVERYGRPERQYREFADTYGFDVRAWPGYTVLRELRELTMTTWIMQNIEESPAVEAEFALRVNSLREGDFTRAWHFF